MKHPTLPRGEYRIPHTGVCGANTEGGTMKKKIHPQYKETTITCACGEVIQTRSTRESIRVEICSKCHPFFTGKQKLIDTAGRVEKFRKRYGK